MILLLAVLACDEPAPQVTADPVAAYTRASVDLRGRLPTPAERQAATADLDAALDTLLDDDGFGGHFADLVAPVWRTRVDVLQALADDLRVERSLGDEPLQILARIAREDLPYTEIVTGDWTMANDHTASLWPVQRTSDGPGWQPAVYTDGRPAAGVLSTNGLWWRYSSTAENVNRGRANALSRILLCSDFSSRPVVFERTATLLDPDALRAETRSNPACANCHSSLDPLAGYLYGFWYFDETSARATYNPGTERLWQSMVGIPPAFFGDPGWTLDDLGHQIAADPRFIECAVDTAWTALLRREPGPDDHAALARHRAAFLDGGLTLRALVRSILDDPAWRAAGDDALTDGAHLLPPPAYAALIADLTGWRWTFQELPMLDNDVVGLRTLAGGADGREVTSEARVPSATTVLVVHRVSEMAALYAVEHDADRADPLFPPGALAGNAAPTAVVAALHHRIFGTTPADGSPELRLGAELYADALALEDDPARAWAVVLAWLLRDPDLLLH